MSDIEHEYVPENQRLRAELGRVRDMAARALAAAKETQDDAAGQHDPWLDEALGTLGVEDAQR